MFNKLFKKKESPVTLQKGDDQELVLAFEKARKSLQSFWHQVSLDFNRIVPALEMACLKVQFSDEPNKSDSKVEHMWVNQIDFDGLFFSGVLLNSPNDLKKYKSGDNVNFPRSQITDWLCVIDQKVYGGFTIQLIRSRMSNQERAQFDAAWGLNFPPPETVLIPEHNDTFENNLAGLLAEEIKKDSSIVNRVFAEGRTLLHLSALYGRLPSVDLLLRSGADKQIKCSRGWTAADYATSFEWKEILHLLNN